MTEQNELTGNDPADPTTPTSAADVELDAVRTPDGETDGELIDPDDEGYYPDEFSDDESSEQVSPA